MKYFERKVEFKNFIVLKIKRRKGLASYYLMLVKFNSYFTLKTFYYLNKSSLEAMP